MDQINERTRDQMEVELNLLRQEVQRLRRQQQETTSSSVRFPPDGSSEDTQNERSSEGLSSSCAGLVVELDQLKKAEADRQHFRSLATQAQQRVKELEEVVKKNAEEQEKEKKRGDPDGNGNEEKLREEVKRLKEHLVRVEEEYTEEVLRVERERDQLRDELVAKSEEVRQWLSSEEGKGAALRTLQTENQQLSHQMSLLEDRLERSNASVKNLQLVVEQIQRENERKLTNQRKAMEESARQWEEKCSRLESALERTRTERLEQEEALGAAQRLLIALDEKERHLAMLRDKIVVLESEVKKGEEVMKEMKEKEENKLDKPLMKSLMVQFLSSAVDRKPEIQRLLARILDFNEQEMRRTGTQLSTRGNQSESLSKSFVHFLEEESKKPEVTNKAIPEVTRDLSRSLIQSSLKNNPFLISRSSSSQSLSSSNNETNCQSINPLFIDQLFLNDNQILLTTSSSREELEEEEKKN